MFDATPLLRAYARFRRAALARQNPAEAQRRTLLRLLRRARHTWFGRDHDFDRIRSVDDFRRAVPLRRYEDLWRDYWEAPFPQLDDVTWPGRIPYFAQSSGTSSGRTKFIPVSAAMNRSNTRAGLDLLVHHVTARPGSHVLGGANFLLGGSVRLEPLAEGIASGDLTGIARRALPRWARPYTFPGNDLAEEEDWERKIETAGRASLDADIRTLAGTPSWVLLFLDRLATLSGRDRRIADHYPDLELLVHGGVNFRPYRGAFEEWLTGSRAELREVYPASEGFIALADAGPEDGLRLLLDTGIFYEFVPVEELNAPVPTRHWVGTAEPGVDYAIVLSTCAGAWAYLLGDTVRLVDRDPPRLVVTGRTSYYISAFGEHLSGEEIDIAVLGAAASMGAEVSEYALGARFPDAGHPRGRHLLVIEFRDPAPLAGRADAFAQALDRRLCELNRDYESHRAEGFGMDMPEVVAVAPGTFAGWMRARGRLGGQNKVPRVVNEQRLLDSLETFARARAAF